MPKIFEYFGFIFFFYSNEHEPIHVHVMHNGCQSIFDLLKPKYNYEQDYYHRS